MFKQSKQSRHRNALRGGVQRVLAALAMGAVALGPMTVNSALADTDPTAAGTYDEQHPILAYYYAWWEPAKLTWGSYQPTKMPFPGARQISDDQDLERTHIAEARSAGIDGFIVNRGADLGSLLDVAHGSDFRITIQLDAHGDVAGQLAAFYAHASDPGMVTYQGRPVLFFWQASAHPNGFWSDMRAQFDPDHTAVWLTDGDQFGFMAGDAWDGISPYAIAWSPSPASQLPAWGAKARAAAPDKLYVPPVSPGCDDSVVRAATCVRDRADGQYYAGALQGALAAHPQWAVVISTWNEWMESTSIEPAVQYGDLYLQLTRGFADAFKSP